MAVEVDAPDVLPAELVPGERPFPKLDDVELELVPGVEGLAPPTRLVAERNAEDALIADPALDAPVFIWVALPAAGVAVFATVTDAELGDAPVGEAVVGVRVPRSRGAINIAKRSAVVVPVRRMVLTSTPLATRVVRIWTPGLLSLASLRDAKSPTARAPPRETAIQNFAHLLISGQIFESVFEASRPATPFCRMAPKTI